MLSDEDDLPPAPFGSIYPGVLFNEVTMQALVSVVVGGVITAVVGNALIHRWQLRSWYAQQRHLGFQKELADLKCLLDEVTTGCDTRLYSMRELTNILRDGSLRRVEAALKDYRDIVKEWNSSLNSYYTRLTLHVGMATSLRLERHVHKPFVIIGQVLERGVRAVHQGETLAPAELAMVDESLNGCQTSILRFSQDLLNAVQRRSSEIAEGRKIWYIDGKLAEYSSLDLIKALFASDIDSLYIIRPA